MDCIFCKIINQEIPAKIVLENEYVLAFEDINPIAPVHVLVVPKKHIESLIALGAEDNQYILEIHKAIKEIAKMKEIDTKGFRVITNIGEDGGQTVKHLHYHVIGGEKLPEKMI